MKLYRITVKKAVNLEGKKDVGGFISYSYGTTAAEAIASFAKRMVSLGYAVDISEVRCLGEVRPEEVESVVSGQWQGIFFTVHCSLFTVH